MNNKKEIRKQFRDAVFKRDNYKCVMCGNKAVDSHHITDRNEISNGGYVVENGISLCSECHIKAEEYHQGKKVDYLWTPESLYNKIGSSFKKACDASSKL
jgi:5-methylcytosine-specific restriction endonuclease McrA